MNPPIVFQTDKTNPAICHFCPIRITPATAAIYCLASGPKPDSLGCLLEISHDGTQLLVLPNGEQRSYLEDGDDVIFHALAQRSGLPSIGFGTAIGRVMQAGQLQ